VAAVSNSDRCCLCVGKLSCQSSSNGLESGVDIHDDITPILDEPSKEAGEAAYVLANGQDKTRSRADGSLRRRSSCLSADEICLAHHAAGIGMRLLLGVSDDRGTGTGASPTECRARLITGGNLASDLHHRTLPGLLRSPP
jgi:hypothetical protein